MTDKQIIENEGRIQMKTLYFEGAGMAEADISRATVGNCRIRTAFHLDDGRAVYLEINSAERTKHSSRQIYQWRYTGSASRRTTHIPPKRI